MLLITCRLGAFLCSIQNFYEDCIGVSRINDIVYIIEYIHKLVKVANYNEKKESSHYEG